MQAEGYRGDVYMFNALGDVNAAMRRRAESERAALEARQDREREIARQELQQSKLAKSFFKLNPDLVPSGMLPEHIENLGGPDASALMHAVITSKELQRAKAIDESRRVQDDYNRALLSRFNEQRAADQALSMATAGAMGEGSLPPGLQLGAGAGMIAPQYLDQARSPVRGFMEGVGRYPEAAQSAHFPQLLHGFSAMQPKAGWNLKPGTMLQGPNGAMLVATTPDQFQVLPTKTAKLTDEEEAAENMKLENWKEVPELGFRINTVTGLRQNLKVTQGYEAADFDGDGYIRGPKEVQAALQIYLGASNPVPFEGMPIGKKTGAATGGGGGGRTTPDDFDLWKKSRSK